MIGDTVSAALIAADGTADWWCPRRFDASPVLTRLLEPAGACLRLGPDGPGPPPAGDQRYEAGSMVLVTTMEGRESLVEVTDAMPWQGGAADWRIVRRLRVLRGPLTVALDVVPPPGEVSVWSEGVTCAGMVVRAPMAFELGSSPPPGGGRARRRPVARGTARLDTGESLVVTVDPPGRPGTPLAPDAADLLLARTVTAWRRTIAGAIVEGPHADAAVRSILVLQALAGGGAPVGSPVTSLPRVVGGERNTDGRVVQPAVAARWAVAAAAAGLAEASDGAVRWLAAALEHEPPLPSALAPDAGAPPTEAVLTGLSGWRGSQPVLAGTNAGERRTVEPGAAVLAAASVLGGELEAAWERVVVHADWLADHWDDPDATVWDLAGPARSWVAPHLALHDGLTRAAASARSRNPLDLDAAGWVGAVRDIERWLLRDGVTADGILRSPGGDQCDAGLARAAWLGPWPAWDHVVVATLERIRDRNADGPWLVPWPADVDDGRPGTEPASVVATLWWARAAALAGRTDEAHERIEAAVALGGPLGLLPESVDARTGMALGNRPSAAAHTALLEAILAVG